MTGQPTTLFEKIINQSKKGPSEKQDMNPTPQNNLQQFWRARAAVRNGNGNHAQHKDPLSRRHDSAGKAIEVSPQDYPLGHVSFLLFLMQNQTNFLIGLGSLLKNFGVTQPRLRIENTSGDPLNTYMIINGKQFDKISSGNWPPIFQNFIMFHGAAQGPEN